MTSAETLVLIVEDEPAIAELVKFSLREDHWTFRTAATVGEAWEFIQQQPPHLVLLDWMLRGESGLRLLSRLRADRGLHELPVILLTGRTLDEDLAMGMDSGADDYVTKPFSPRELAIRAKAVLRRRGDSQHGRPLQVGPLALDPRSCTVRVGSEPIEVRQAEYRLLKFLLCHPGQVFSRAQLLEQVWYANGTLDERTVDVHVLRLRKALREAKSLLKTVRGFGYKLSAT
ncbi:response regulator [Massilia solisilvae]|uniref:Response regulator n=1 Tax=Massilia solisilvae TaxID=1811225 RepID=A0ABT2BPZ3_9BURK|nr:response regulator [Massilia solisilvae]MCS0610582.1 response regulator [Massilia solisilvae]